MKEGEGRGWERTKGGYRKNLATIVPPLVPLLFFLPSIVSSLFIFFSSHLPHPVLDHCSAVKDLAKLIPAGISTTMRGTEIRRRVFPRSHYLQTLGVNVWCQGNGEGGRRRGQEGGGDGGVDNELTSSTGPVNFFLLYVFV